MSVYLEYRTFSKEERNDHRKSSGNDLHRVTPGTLPRMMEERAKTPPTSYHPQTHPKVEKESKKNFFTDLSTFHPVFG